MYEGFQQDEENVKKVVFTYGRAEDIKAFLRIIQATAVASPPDGWFPFGSHAAYPWTGDLEFSEEKGEDGLSLWERPKYHQDHDKLARMKAREESGFYDPVKIIERQKGELPPYFAPKPPINTNRFTTGESNE